MNVIVSIIVAMGFVLLIRALLTRSSRDSSLDELRREVHQRTEDEFCQLTQQLEPDSQSNENVTPFRTPSANRSRCAACGAIITANDERCPSCDIAFVADGSQKWTLGTVGPADGIYLPSTEVRK